MHCPSRRAPAVEELRRDREHRHVHEAGQPERDDHVGPLEAQHPAPLGLVPGFLASGKAIEITSLSQELYATINRVPAGKAP